MIMPNFVNLFNRNEAPHREHLPYVPMFTFLVFIIILAPNSVPWLSKFMFHGLTYLIVARIFNIEFLFLVPFIRSKLKVN